eukprot:COSAG02_NODE_26_length_51927_cov_61.213881_5_plen_118_part_00
MIYEGGVESLTESHMNLPGTRKYCISVRIACDTSWALRADVSSITNARAPAAAPRQIRASARGDGATVVAGRAKRGANLASRGRAHERISCIKSVSRVVCRLGVGSRELDRIDGDVQ